MRKNYLGCNTAEKLLAAADNEKVDCGCLRLKTQRNLTGAIILRYQRGLFCSTRFS